MIVFHRKSTSNLVSSGHRLAVNNWKMQLKACMLASKMKYFWVN